MSETPSTTLQPRTSQAQLFMAMPMLFGALLMASVMVLGGLVWMGGTPTGPRVTITLQGSCAAEAGAMVESRVSAMGLGAPVVEAQGDDLRVTVTLPGLDEARERTALPALLGQAGRLAVRDGGELVLDSEGVHSAGLQLDENGSAMAVVEMTKPAAAVVDARIRASPDGALSIWLDGVQVADRPNTMLIDGTALRIIGADSTPKVRMAQAADQVILLQHGPLPCDLAVGSVVEVQPGS